MEYQCPNLFLMQQISSISQQKIYPTIPIKIEMPLWKTLQITRLWNHAREQEIYLSQQQQQKHDWWIQQMALSHHATYQPLETYLPSWLDDTTSTETPTIDTTAPELTTCELGHLPANDGIDLVHDDDDDDDEEGDVDTMITAATTTTTQTPGLLAQDDLTSLLGESTQPRKRKHKSDSSTQENPTQPPATRASSPMVKA